MADVVVTHEQERMKALAQDSDWLTLNESAAILKIDRRTMTRRFDDGTIPGMKIGDKWRTKKSVLDKLLTLA